MLFSGAISGHDIRTGAFVDSSHVVVVTESSHLLMIDNSGAISWKQQHTNLSSGL